MIHEASHFSGESAARRGERGEDGRARRGGESPESAARREEHSEDGRVMGREGGGGTTMRGGESTAMR